MEDQNLSKKLSEVEERKNQYLARQVESADQQPEPNAPKGESSSSTIQSGTRDPPGPLETDDDHPDGVISWIECAQDKRTWAEVREEEL